MLHWVIYNFIIAFLMVITPRKLLSLVWLSLAFLVAFRYRIGPDYLQYEFIHQEILNGNTVFLQRTELFHIGLTNLVDYIGANFQLVLVSYTVFIFFFFYKGFQYYSPKTKLWDTLVLLFFFTFMFFPLLNGLRQVLAVAIFLYASKYILERQVFKYVVVITLSIFIHKSAIILLPLYWVVNWRINTALLWLCIISLVIFAFIDPLPYLGIVYSKFNLPYAEYLDYGRFSASPGLFVTLTTLGGLLSLLGLFFLDRNNKEENLIFNMILIVSLLKVLTLHMLVIGRVAYYFKPFTILFMVYVCYKIFKKLSDKETFFVGLSVILWVLSLLQLWGISKQESAYRQYSMNFSLFNDPKPVQIFGDYSKVEKWEK